MTLRTIGATEMRRNESCVGQVVNNYFYCSYYVTPIPVPGLYITRNATVIRLILYKRKYI